MKVQPTNDVTRILSSARTAACAYGHASITTWHVLYALCNDKHLRPSLDEQFDVEEILIDTSLKLDGLTVSSSKSPNLSHEYQVLFSACLRVAAAQNKSLDIELLLEGLVNPESEVSSLLISYGAQESVYKTYQKWADAYQDVFSKPLTEETSTNVTPPLENNVPDSETSSTTMQKQIQDAIAEMPFLEDMTALSNYYDPVIGRDEELQSMIEVLLRRTKNNPLLLGLPGVGKTTLVEGLAQRISTGDVPEGLAGMKLLRIDLTSILVGTSYQGDLEQRIQTLFDLVGKSDDSIIFFIDEIHLLGQRTALQGVASMLKPALARGRLRLIGSTTFSEYRQYLDTDKALSRRFENIEIKEPSTEQAIKMIRAIAPTYETFHRLRINDHAIAQAVNLSKRYMPNRCLPDKAVSLIDHACARAHARKENTVGVAQINKAMSTLTDVPIESLNSSEKDRLKRLEQMLNDIIINQEESVEMISHAIRRSRTGVGDPSRPWGSFLFLGPTGVGKTELAKRLSQYLMDNDNLVRFDMSEYGEAHSVSRLIGAPPGYVGYDKGGLLTEAVRQRPYSVVLLDEVEKAHPDVLNVFLQVLDDGRLTDGQGNAVDFRNTILIFTSNVGAEELLTADSIHKGQSLVLTLARKAFRPELFNRFDDVLVFNPLRQQDMLAIVKTMLKDTISRLAQRGVELHINEDVVAFLAKEGFDPELGARPMRRAITRYIENKASSALVEAPAMEKMSMRIRMNGNSTEAIVGKRGSV